MLVEYVRHVVAEAPLLGMRGYASDLRSLTRGRCAFAMDLVAVSTLLVRSKRQRADPRLAQPRDSQQGF
ncbi:MAG: hypothetical protein VX293_12265 [Candidatus Latescibacterota bacterium]|nr:hypothetical protein [Candidatus Latescibacterota bacterium]